MQARYIMSIGMILESDASYPDKREASIILIMC